jgi:ATP-dependent Clp protease adaptor protein ClpS
MPRRSRGRARHGADLTRRRPLVSTTETQTRPDQATRQRTRQELCPPWKVLLHNDDVNTMDHVIHALTQSVPGLPGERAVRIMLEAHLRGLAVVTVCPLETAEYYRDRLLSFRLTSTIEPDE